jgi:hypothetical protein
MGIGALSIEFLQDFNARRCARRHHTVSAARGSLALIPLPLWFGPGLIGRASQPEQLIARIFTFTQGRCEFEAYLSQPFCCMAKHLDAQAIVFASTGACYGRCSITGVLSGLAEIEATNGYGVLRCVRSRSALSVQSTLGCCVYQNSIREVLLL